MLIYIAAPYGRRAGLSDDQCLENVNKAIVVAREVIKLGHTPFVPHLFHFIHKDWKDTPDEDTWLKLCKIFIPYCHAVLRLPGESVGADNEVAMAKDFRLPVYYSIEHIKGMKK